MELFKILGTVAVDGLDSAEKGLSNLGNVATKVGKAIAAGLAAGATAVGVIAKKSLEAYADYEQLVGGIETLFGTRGAKTVEEYAELVGKSVEDVSAEFEMLQSAQSTAMDNAAKAYKNAGLSANEYMETVTSIAAALNQSTASELESAEYANMAIEDMADNANKMGTSMSSIQTAYQGFAKQNYSMLDNLKLGYGGTAQEMYRLLCDAKELDDTFDAVFSIDDKGHLEAGFADIVEAIHIVQGEMGITGTTSKEAASTIQGSLAMAKSAWKNLLTGFADDEQDLGLLIDNLVESAAIAVHNIVPRMAQILSGISDAMTQIMPIITAELPVILQELLPGVINGAVALLNGLIASLPTILQILIEQLPFIFTQISAGLVQTFPILLDTVKKLFGQIWDYIAVELLGTEADFESSFGKIQEIFSGLWEAAQYVWESIGQPIWDMIQGCVEQVKYVFGIYMPLIRQFVSQCFTDIQTFWNNNLKPCLDAIGNFIKKILAPAFETVFKGTVMPAVSSAFNFIKSIWNDTLKPVFTGITDFLTGVFTGNWKQAWEGIKSFQKGIINGIISGIELMVNGAISALNGLIAGLNKLVSAAGSALGLNISIPTIPLLNLPRLEEGGILEKGQIGLLEGNGAEAVVPLDQNKAWIRAVARDMDAAIGGGQQVQELKEAFNDFVEVLPEMLIDAFTAMKFDVNNREFARLVKAVN